MPYKIKQRNYWCSDGRHVTLLRRLDGRHLYGAGLVLGGGRLAECDEEVGEVVAEVAGVDPAEHRLDVDADRQPLRVRSVNALKTGGVAGRAPSFAWLG